MRHSEFNTKVKHGEFQIRMILSKGAGSIGPQ